MPGNVSLAKTKTDFYGNLNEKMNVVNVLLRYVIYIPLGKVKSSEKNT